jgi:hypothetical protein
MPLQGNLSIERMCELARVSRARFFRSLKVQRPTEEETEVRSAIQQIALEHRRRYGYRRRRVLRASGKAVWTWPPVGAVDAGPVQIQSWEGAALSHADTVLQGTTHERVRAESGYGKNVS